MPGSGGWAVVVVGVLNHDALPLPLPPPTTHFTVPVLLLLLLLILLGSRWCDLMRFAIGFEDRGTPLGDSSDALPVILW